MFALGNVAITVLLGLSVEDWLCYGLGTTALVCVCYEFVAMTGSFIYRYLVLCHKEFVGSIHGKRLLIGSGLFVLGDAGCFVGLLYWIRADKYKLRGELLQSDFAWVAYQYRNFCGTSSSQQWVMILFYTFFLVNAFICFSVAWYCREKALVPSFILMPAGIIYVLHALGILGPEYVPHLIFFLLQKASLASPIINLVSVQAYRSWIMENCRRFGYFVIGQHVPRTALGHVTVVTLREL
ncbi:hypothetical protein FO519_001083 [Halicephalobus sp. NKZ332]|nr:hypothetical protein FO519_001083 [Halicephalobus sp. NKZ332]